MISKLTILQILCRPLPLDWNFSCESDDNSPPGAGNNLTVHQPQVHEKMWGEILEKSFSTRDLSDIGDEDSQIYSSTSSSASCPHSQGNHTRRLMHSNLTDIGEIGVGEKVLLNGNGFGKKTRPASNCNGEIPCSTEKAN